MHTVVLETPCAPIPQALEVGNDKKSGRQGDVYFTAPGRYGRDYAVKIYKPERPYDRNRLFEMRDYFAVKSAVAGKEERAELESIMIPLAIVKTFDGTPAIGFVMLKAGSNYCELVDCIASGKTALEQFKAGQNWSDFLNVALNTAACVRLLHGYSLTHTDIHHRNFMVDMRTNAVVLLESENVILPSPPAIAASRPTVRGGMRGFIAPEMIPEIVPGVKPKPPPDLPDVWTDLFSLAVLILYILLFRNVMQALVDCVTGDPDTSDRGNQGKFAAFSEHPYETRNRPKRLGNPFLDPKNGGCLSYTMLTPELQLLTRKALIFGLHADRTCRPTARAWEAALARAVDMLWTCRNCDRNFPYPFWQPAAVRAFPCPFCGVDVIRRALVLTVYEQRKGTSDGIYLPTPRFQVLGPRARLTEKMFTDARTQDAPIGAVLLQQSPLGYVLRNESNRRWHIYTLDSITIDPVLRVEPGATIRARKGMLLDLGNPSFRVLIREIGDF